MKQYWVVEKIMVFLSPGKKAALSQPKPLKKKIKNRRKDQPDREHPGRRWDDDIE